MLGFYLGSDSEFSWVIEMVSLDLSVEFKNYSVVIVEI